MRTLPFVWFGLALVGRAAAAQEQPAGPLTIDVTKLVARRDSFAVRVQGVPIGYIKGTLETGAFGFRYTETSSINGLVEQATILELDPAGRMTSVRQHGVVQGQSASIEVEYGNGRVHGSASTTAAEGLKTVAIDTTVPTGTLDDNAIQSILPAVPLAPGASWSVGVFTAAASEFRLTTLKVTGVEPTAGDSGPVDSYKVEWSGVVQPTTFWVTTEAPHRIVRIAVAGAPIEIVRINPK